MTTQMNEAACYKALCELSQPGAAFPSCCSPVSAADWASQSRHGGSSFPLEAPERGPALSCPTVPNLLEDRQPPEEMLESCNDNSCFQMEEKKNPGSFALPDKHLHETTIFLVSGRKWTGINMSLSKTGLDEFLSSRAWPSMGKGRGP